MINLIRNINNKILDLLFIFPSSKFVYVYTKEHRILKKIILKNKKLEYHKYKIHWINKKNGILIYNFVQPEKFLQSYLKFLIKN